MTQRNDNPDDPIIRLLRIRCSSAQRGASHPKDGRIWQHKYDCYKEAIRAIRKGQKPPPKKLPFMDFR